jgi:hypothetical protein
MDVDRPYLIAIIDRATETLSAEAGPSHSRRFRGPSVVDVFQCFGFWAVGGPCTLLERKADFGVDSAPPTTARSPIPNLQPFARWLR